MPSVSGERQLGRRSTIKRAASEASKSVASTRRIAVIAISLTILAPRGLSSSVTTCLGFSAPTLTPRNPHRWQASNRNRSDQRGCLRNVFVGGHAASTSTAAPYASSCVRRQQANSRVRALAMSAERADDGEPTNVKHVVIAGGGVIGTTTAYYLARDFNIACTIVDPSGAVAPAASGKAGGFLALDWNDHSPVGPLARRSFQLHQEIADAVGAEKIQYRRLTCAAVSVNEMKNGRGGNRPSGKKLEGVEWADGQGVLGMQPLGSEETIAQVHPKRLCETLLEETRRMASSTKIVQGKVAAPVHESAKSDGGDANSSQNISRSQLKGVKLEDGTLIDADALLYACGPWTSSIMTGVKYHSVVVPTDEVLSQCVFFSGAGDPEVYVRPDRTAYLTGFPDDPVRVTEEPGHEEVRPEKIKRIRQAVQMASPAAPWSGKLAKTRDTNSSVDDDSTRLGSSTSADCVESSCYLPSTPDGMPLMGPLASSADGDMPGCYIAAGHSCWGILMGPATGEAMAHLIATGKESPRVSLFPFRPGRFGTNAMRMVPTAR